MRHLITTVCTVALMLASLSASAADKPFWTTPTIHGYGKIHYLPKAKYQPEASETYKIVFTVTKSAKKPDQVNPSLDHVARAVNAYVAAGVPLSHLKFVAVAAGPGTPSMLDDAHYRKLYGVANPNLDLISQLRKAGVDVSVCGQAVAEHHFQYDWINHDVSLSLSGLVTVTTLEHKGYSLMPF